MTRAALELMPGVGNALREEACRAYPLEACGMLAGKGTLVSRIIPMRNLAEGNSADSAFSLDPLELWRKEREAASLGLEVMGFYHSHPDRGATPSRRDEAEMVPGSAYLILSVSGDGRVSAGAFRKRRPGCPVEEIRLIDQK